MKRLIYFVSNALIFISTLGSLIRYFFMLRRFEKVQVSKKKLLYEHNRETAYIGALEPGNQSDSFEGLPLSDWRDYEEHIRQITKGRQNVLTRDKVVMLEPTSGTTTHTKLIPYTRALQREFNLAVQPWLAGLYLGWPSLLWSTQYWSISPASQAKNEEQSVIPIGFEVDSQYLGDKRSKILNQIMAVPAWVRNIPIPENWSYATLFYLVRDKNLGMISVWHPSFLVILLEKIKGAYPKLIADVEKGRISINAETEYDLNESVNSKSSSPDFDNLSLKPHPGRARQLRRLSVSDKDFYCNLWPRLKVISCWADDENEASLLVLRKLFPEVYFQPKGIIATEGIISFPFRKTAGLPAYHSHVLEFIDVINEKLLPLHKLQLQQQYEPVISTGGGLYRYRMNDLVTVIGFYRSRLPQLKFLCKRDYVSDIRGEKVHLHHVIEIQTTAMKRWPGIVFFMIAPVIKGSRAFYTCFVFIEENTVLQSDDLSRIIDEGLSNNFHYQYARQIGQLDQPAIFHLEKNPVEEVVNHIESTGIKRGDIKLTPLSRLTGWEQILPGRFLKT